MTETPVGLSFLLARLNHASGMVRERACVALARLLVEVETSKATRVQLQLWLDSQTMESVAISAILVWIRARMEDQSVRLPEPAEFVGGFPLPSLLSWLLFQDLYGSEMPELDWHECCSADARPGFEPDQIFHKYKESVNGGFFLRAAQAIDESWEGLFSLQWAREWAGLVESANCKTRERIFWQRGDNESRW